VAFAERARRDRTRFMRGERALELVESDQHSRHARDGSTPRRGIPLAAGSRLPTTGFGVRTARPRRIS
jgi:hypothetical protein